MAARTLPLHWKLLNFTAKIRAESGGGGGEHFSGDCGYDFEEGTSLKFEHDVEPSPIDAIIQLNQAQLKRVEATYRPSSERLLKKSNLPL